MAWYLTEDVEEYFAAAGTFLRTRPAHNTVLLTVAESVRVRGRSAFGGDTPLFGCWRSDESGVSGAFVHTPPLPMALSQMPAQAARELVPILVDRGRTLTGVNAHADTANVSTQAWQDATGVEARVRRRDRLYRLGKLSVPDPRPAGAARVARDPDRDLLLGWLRAFFRDIGEPEERAESTVDERLLHGGLYLWELGGVPVAVAGLTRSVAGMARVGAVYTPPAMRGRGYGAAVTAAVSQVALDSGADDVVLFADAANPTSNGIYQRIGYEPIEDRLFVQFVA
ncbi:GNAT family N-acetyltransferase [Longimycelium tulufanense]|uniref:GNAT family N-acetyltransferase n=1 Tax=Longimycelium tulufanense TaxID=907463 RepID=UPI00166AB0F5|nr:GNAT family N-acetyltransferase [Longimycelium tulufanense]